MRRSHKIKKWKKRIIVGCVCAAAFTNLCIVRAEEQRNDMLYEGLPVVRKAVLLYDVSGSSCEKENLVHDVEYIFYSILKEDPLVDCSLFCFDEKITLVDEWKFTVSNKETNLYEAISKVDQYIKNGKKEVSLVLVSDFYDTYEGKKLYPGKDDVLLEIRRKESERILKEWEDEKGFETNIYSWKSLKEPAYGYTRLLIGEDDVKSVDEGDTFKNLRECFRNAQRIRTGIDEPWIAFEEIPDVEEEQYEDYFVCAEEELEFPKFAENSVERLLPELRMGGYFYCVHGVPLSQMEFHTSTQKIYICQLNELKISCHVTQVLDEKEALHSERTKKIKVSLKIGEREVFRDGIQLQVMHENGRVLCDLEYNQDSGQYEGEFELQRKGVHNLVVKYKNEEGMDREIYNEIIEIYTRDIELKEGEKFREKIYERLFDSSSDECIELSDYFVYDNSVELKGELYIFKGESDKREHIGTVKEGKLIIERDRMEKLKGRCFLGLILEYDPDIQYTGKSYRNTFELSFK